MGHCFFTDGTLLANGTQSSMRLSVGSGQEDQHAQSASQHRTLTPLQTGPAAQHATFLMQGSAISQVLKLQHSIKSSDSTMGRCFLTDGTLLANGMQSSTRLCSLCFQIQTIRHLLHHNPHVFVSYSTLTCQWPSLIARFQVILSFSSLVVVPNLGSNRL